MKRLIALAGFVVLLGLGAGPSQGDGAFVCRPFVSSYSWRTMPIHYAIDSGIPRDVLEKALSRWQSVSLRFQEDQDTTSRFEAGAVGGYAAYAWAWPKPGSTEIVSFTVILNPTQIEAQGARWDTVLTHEVGHIVGLGHATCRDSVMRDTVYPGMTWDTLFSGDREARDSLYPVYRVYLPVF